jgi:hypothetical protein
MRIALLVTAGAVLLTTACSSDPKEQSLSENVQRWAPGAAVVVLAARVDPGFAPDVEALGRRPGVISVSMSGGQLKLALSRQAALVDLAALRAELGSTAGLSHLSETFTAPSTR